MSFINKLISLFRFRCCSYSNVTSPQLYHCTSIESICKILDSGHFRPAFCLEQSNFMEEYPAGAYAMVCFADLLPNEVDRHLHSFSSNSYIVMSKEWAFRNHISPVVYYNKEAIPSATMKHWSKFFVNNQDRIDINGSEKLLYNSTCLMFAYMKQYEGVYYDKKRGRFSDEKRVFYLEREWRYVPMVENGEAYYLNEEAYCDTDYVKVKTDELINHGYTLKFTPQDIMEFGIPKDKVAKFRENLKKEFDNIKIVEL